MKQNQFLIIGEVENNDIKQVTYELASKAKQLASKINSEVSALIIGRFELSENIIEKLKACGISELYYANDEIVWQYDDGIYANIAFDLIKETSPSVVLAPATPKGRSFIPAVATLLETGLTADCIDLDLEGQNLIQKRPAWGGNMIVDILCPNNRPQMATIRPGIFPVSINPSSYINVTKINTEKYASSKTFEIISIYDEAHENKLTTSDLVIAVGRGVKKELIPIVEEVVRMLNAAMGATRPICDEKILPYSYQIGQSGVTIKPKVCISIGISGAMQYTIGIKDAEINIAVNNDKDAPIFDIANYGIIEDAQNFITTLHKKLKELKGV